MPIHFDHEKICTLFQTYARTLFFDAAVHLIRHNLLSDYERKLIAVIKKATQDKLDFFRHSSIIFLSNAIIDQSRTKELEDNKKQLMFEISMRLLLFKIAKRVNHKGSKIFSITLNQQIDHEFDAIERQEDNYLFTKDGVIVQRLQKNQDLIITPFLDFIKEDLNPFNCYQDHPDQVFERYDLADIPLPKWVERFRESYKLIEDQTPDIFREISYFLDLAGPRGHVPGVNNSSSYYESPGILYISYSGAIKMAEALVHEIHHTIYYTILRAHPLLNNDLELKFYSAYRPDARHMNGTFLGLHAFIAVQNFYAKLSRKPGFETHLLEFFDLFLKNEITRTVVSKYAELTEEGKHLFNDMCEKMEIDREYFDKMKVEKADVFAEAQKTVDERVKKAKEENEILLM